MLSWLSVKVSAIQDLAIVLRKEIKALLWQRVLVVEWGLAAVMAGSILPFFLVSRIPSQPMAILALSTVYPFLSLFALLFTTFSSVRKVFVTEKTQRTLETLLTTPLCPRTIWLGKCLTIFFGAYAYTLVLLALLTAGLHIAAAIQSSDLGLLLPPPLAAVRSLVTLPLLVLGLVGFSGLAALLLPDPRSVNAILAIISLLTFLFVLPRAIRIPASNLWAGGELLAAVAWNGACVIGTRLLTKERIVLGKL